MSLRVRHRILLLPCLLGIEGWLAPRLPATQDPGARQAFEAGMRNALDNRPDSSLLLFTRAADGARGAAERPLRLAALRGRADVWLTLRGCPDSALRILRDAAASADPGDRSAADALVQLLAANGDAAGARTALVVAYADASGASGAITSGRVAFLRGNAAIERAEGHESAALSTLNEAIAIADRLHQVEARDPRDTHALGEVTRENAWLIYDLAQLRAQAKSPGIHSARESARLMSLLLAAWSVVDDLATSSPTVRLRDRLVLRAERCRVDGTSCPLPTPTPAC